MDTFTGTSGNDTFNAPAGTFTGLDAINGGAGNDTMNWSETTAISGTPAGATVTGVETVVVSDPAGITLDTTTGWTGLTQLTATSASNAQILTVAATTNVTATDSAAAITIVGGNNVSATTSGGVVTIGGAVATTASPAGTITVKDTALSTAAVSVDGGTTVAVTVTGDNKASASTADITVGSNLKPTGAVTVSATAKANNDGAGTTTKIGAISIKGGTTVSVTEAIGSVPLASGTTNDTNNMGNVSVGGSTLTTAVSVTQAAAATAKTGVDAVTGVAAVSAVSAAPGVAAVTAVTGVSQVKAIAAAVGVSTGTVDINDYNATNSTTATTSTKGGSITSVTLANYGTTNISSAALNTLTLSGTGGTVTTYEGGSTSATNTTLTLNVNGLPSTAPTTYADGSNQFKTINVVTGTTASTLANINDTALTALNVSGVGGVTFTSLSGATALTAITVTGSAGVTASVTDTTQSFDASGSTGAQKITIAADATKVVTGGSGAADEIILNAAGTTFTAAKTGVKVTGFEILGTTAATASDTIDVSVFGTGIAKVDMTADSSNSVTFNNIPQNAALNFTGSTTSAAKNQTGNLAFNYADAAGATDTVAITVGGNSYADTTTGAWTNAAQTIGNATTAVSIVDSNNVAVGTLNFTDNNGGFNYAGDTFYLADGAYSNISLAGAGGLTISGVSTTGYYGSTSGKTAVTNTATSLTLTNTGTNAAGLVINMIDNSLGNVTFAGSAKVTLNLADTVAGTLNLTNSGTSTASVNALTLGARTMTLSGAVGLTTTNNNAKTITLGTSAVKINDNYNGTDGVTVSGANVNSASFINLSGSGVALKTDTVTLGNGNNQIIDQNSTATSNVAVTVGTGSNFIALGGTGGASSYTVSSGTHASTTVASVYEVGAAGSGYASAANYVITGAQAGDIISFSNDVASSNSTLTATSLTSATSVAGALSTLETAANTAHKVTYGTYGGDTYIVETVSGTVGSTDTTVVKLAGYTGTLTASTGFVTVGSTATTAPTITTTLPVGGSLTLGDNFNHTITSSGLGSTTISLAGTGTQTIDVSGDGTGGTNTLTLTSATGATTFTGAASQTNNVALGLGTSFTLAAGVATITGPSSGTFAQTLAVTGGTLTLGNYEVGTITLSGNGSVNLGAAAGNVHQAADTVVINGTTASTSSVSNFIHGTDILKIGGSTSAVGKTVAELAAVTTGFNHGIAFDTAAHLGTSAVTLGNHSADTIVTHYAVASDTGNIYYDADGNWTAGVVLIGTLGVVVGLAVADIKTA